MSVGLPSHICPNHALPLYIEAWMRHVRENATCHTRLTSLLRQEAALQLVLRFCLQPQLQRHHWLPLPIVLATLSIDVARNACDSLYRPAGQDDDLSRFLLQPLPSEALGNDKLRTWVVTRLRWFEGCSVRAVATHTGLSEDTVRRILLNTGTVIDELATAKLLTRRAVVQLRSLSQRLDGTSPSPVRQLKPEESESSYLIPAVARHVD